MKQPECKRRVRTGEYTAAQMTAIMYPANRGGDRKSKHRIQDFAAAKAICEGCPAKFECLDIARGAETNVADDYHHYVEPVARYIFGVFGGMTPKERQRMYYQELEVL
jgi:hypothetical protein